MVDRFEMQKVDSAAAGLRYKVFRLPPNPPGDKEGKLTLQNSSMAVLEVRCYVYELVLRRRNVKWLQCRFLDHEKNH